MFNIVLYEPEIPPNTGNIIRLCVNAGCRLHLIEPLGFVIDDKQMRRAGLDYKEWADIQIYQNYADFLERCRPRRLWGFSSKATKFYHQINYEKDDFFLFGPETRGLPEGIRHELGPDHLLKIPMVVGEHNRSLNLSNSVAVVAYEAWRQLGFIN